MRKLRILSLIGGLLTVWLVAASPAMSECSYFSKIIDKDNKAEMDQEFKDIFDPKRAGDQQSGTSAGYQSKGGGQSKATN